jgi:hypothetical protein
MEMRRWEASAAAKSASRNAGGEDRTRTRRASTGNTRPPVPELPVVPVVATVVAAPAPVLRGREGGRSERPTTREMRASAVGPIANVQLDFTKWFDESPSAFEHATNLSYTMMLALALLLGTASGTSNPEEYINILGGTANLFDFRCGLR